MVGGFIMITLIFLRGNHKKSLQTPLIKPPFSLIKNYSFPFPEGKEKRILFAMCSVYISKFTKLSQDLYWSPRLPDLTLWTFPYENNLKENLYKCTFRKYMYRLLPTVDSQFIRNAVKVVNRRTIVSNEREGRHTEMQCKIYIFHDI